MRGERGQGRREKSLSATGKLCEPYRAKAVYK